MSNNPYYEQDTQFITGFAGSGKSTKIVELATPKTLILTPTHKAAAVLIDKGLNNVYTIHAVLKLVPTINDNFRKKMTTKLTRVGATDLSKITHIIIDEFSMVSEEILNILMGALPDKCHVTIVGDPYQLPPVTGTKIEPWEPIEELTVQYRAKNDNAVALFMEYMYYLRGDTNRLPENTYSQTKDWAELFNPLTDRILAYTNQKVIDLNNVIAEDKPFYYEDELVMNGIPVTMKLSDFNPRIYPSCVAKGKLMDGNKLIKASDKATNDINKYGTNLGMYKQMSIELEGEDYLIYYDPNHYQTEKRLKTEVEIWQKNVISMNNLTPQDNIPDFCRKNRSAQGVRERGKAWSKYLAHTQYVFNVARPYASTVHKAQGSEFSSVFIDEQDIRICKGFSQEQYARLMYVSLSRGIDNIYFI